ncbi:hypothetical protein BREU_2230 [Bifidobacterium reuteri DSM 23975]|uniref:Uncharacterized protein n=1 Tax=Bifidobacterium reuteri DSM 23975 TaxID=1437610 RepID=A0A087CKM8_9BIFI|nr:hypothetical protein BREU_2230 [Bifidobacterium reuteri DSM 23975]
MLCCCELAQRGSPGSIWPFGFAEQAGEWLGRLEPGNMWPSDFAERPAGQPERWELGNAWPYGFTGQAGEWLGRWEPGSMWPFGFTERLGRREKASTCHGGFAEQALSEVAGRELAV